MSKSPCSIADGWFTAGISLELVNREPQLVDCIDEVIFPILQGPCLRIPFFKVHPQELPSDEIHTWPRGMTSHSKAIEPGSSMWIKVRLYSAVLINSCLYHRAPKPMGTASPPLASLFHLTLSDFSSPKEAPKRTIAKRKIWNVCWFNCWSAQSNVDLPTHLKNQSHINWNQLTKTFMLSTGRFDTPTPTGNCLPFVGSFYMLAKICLHFFALLLAYLRCPLLLARGPSIQWR